MVTSVDGKETPWLSFDRLARDAGPQTKTMVIARGDAGPLKLRITAVEVRRGNDYVPAGTEVAAELREVTPGERYELVATLRPPRPNAALTGRVRLETGIERQPSVDVMFSAWLPARLTWKKTSGPVPRSRSETVRWEAELVWSDDSPPGRITSVTPPVQGMTARMEEREGRPVLVVEITPQCPPPTRENPHFVTLKTDDPAVPELFVPVQYEPAPGGE